MKGVKYMRRGAVITMLILVLALVSLCASASAATMAEIGINIGELVLKAADYIADNGAPGYLYDVADRQSRAILKMPIVKLQYHVNVEVLTGVDRLDQAPPLLGGPSVQIDDVLRGWAAHIGFDLSDVNIPELGIGYVAGWDFGDHDLIHGPMLWGRVTF